MKKLLPWILIRRKLVPVFEKASGLRIANISYKQNIETAKKYIDEGRIPLATEFFNKALKSRPSNLSYGQSEEEEFIRSTLEANRQQVLVTIVSDGKTYVSLIGVFAPEQFREKEALLFPDVYTFKGTRRDYLPVESEFKVSKSLSPQTIEIKCEDQL